MKVALVFSGQPRHLDKPQIHEIKNIIHKYDCDIYYHYWWNPLPDALYETAYGGLIKIEKNIDEKIEDLFHPKLSTWEIPLEKDYFSRLYNKDFNQYYNMGSMYTSLKKSFQLIPTDDLVKYTFIVRLRTDVWIDFLPDLYTLDPEKLHFPYSSTPNHLINHCWICPSKYAEKAFSIIDYLFINQHYEYSIQDEKILANIFQYLDLYKHIEFHSIFKFRCDRLQRGKFSEKFSMQQYYVIYFFLFLFVIFIFMYFRIK